MKVSFFESEYGSEISLTPETIEESSALARMALNAKAVKPEIRLYFGEKEQNCAVWLKNISKSVRKTSIQNK